MTTERKLIRQLIAEYSPYSSKYSSTDNILLLLAYLLLLLENRLTPVVLIRTQEGKGTS